MQVDISDIVINEIMKLEKYDLFEILKYFLYQQIDMTFMSLFEILEDI